MSLRIDLLSGADADLQDIFNRFEDYHENFGIEFLTAVEANLTRISVFPMIASQYFEDVRRMVMGKFPYGIFYEAHASRILILAILDLRQDEEQIMRRLRH